MKKKIRNYNPDFPNDTIKIKDIGKIIREKGQELYNFINSIEEDRVTNDLSNLDDLIKFAFLNKNLECDSGIYIKNDDYWIGISTIPSLPDNIIPENNLRFSFNNNSYQFKEISGNLVWTLSNNFKPCMYYDLFQALANEKNTLKNYGLLSSEYSLNLEGASKQQDLLPHFYSNRFFKCRTNVGINLSNSFSFSCLFSNISRNYLDDEIIDLDSYSTLMFIKDKFDVTRIGLIYDKDNKLYLSNKEEIIDLNFILSDSLIYQIAIVFLNNKIKIYINSQVIYENEETTLIDKELYFSICEDNDYGHYANGSANFGEINIFNLAITPQENLILKEHPRSWSHIFTDSYLDLSFEDKVKLKQFIKTLP